MKIGKLGIRLMKLGFVIDTPNRILVLLWLKNGKFYSIFNK